MDINKYIGGKIKTFRERKNITQTELAEYLGLSEQAISRYELGNRKTNNDILFKLADYFNCSINDFFPTFDNAKFIDMDKKMVKIAVYGTIKAGIPIEAQEDITEYVEIPESWLKGGKKFYGLKISGDSMAPKYQENDIVIFESTEDFYQANGKDCAVMVNGYDATFKNVRISKEGIQLIPLNINNSDEYLPMFYNSEQIQSLPVRIMGIAREKRTKL